jgi:hypothetical protein
MLDTHDERVSRGEVRGLQRRTEAQESVYSFRLERYHKGERLPPIPVEMRGASINGPINEGDEVEIFGNWRQGQLKRAKRVYNWTSGTEVSAKQPILMRITNGIAIVVAIAVFVTILVVIMGNVAGW